MSQTFCRDCHATVDEQYYYVHMHWHLTHDEKRTMTCPTCFAMVENTVYMEHSAWHES
jgi:hypothetical protein